MKLWRKCVSGLLAAALTLSLALPGGVLPAARAARTNTLADGLVLYSSFDDADRDGTTVKDLSGNGHHGTATAGVSYDTGVSGQAVKLQGQTKAGDDNNPGDRYVDYGKSAGIIPATGDFSLSLWYRSTGASSNATLLSNKNFKSGSNVGFALGCFDKDLRFNLTDTDKARMDVNKSSAATTPLKDAKDGSWHHLAVTVDRSDKMVFYVDGASAGEQTISAHQKSIDAGLSLVLGAGGNYCNAVDNTLLDELFVFDRVITAAEITSLYNKEKPDFSPLDLDDGLVLHSTFDAAEVSGTTVGDASGKGHTGTVAGSADTVSFVPGVSGNAIRFGESAGGYVTYGASAGIIPATADFSVSLWFKNDGDNNNGTVLATKDYGSGNNTGMVIGAFYNASSRDLRVNMADTAKKRVELAGLSTSDNIAALRMCQDGSWHHLAAVYDRDGDLSVYVDGTLAGSKSIAGYPASIDAGLELVLGADGKGAYPLKNSQVDELRIYDRALSAGEAAALYDLNKPPFDPTAQLLLLAEFEGNADDTSTGSAVYNGTITDADGGITFVESPIGAKAVKIVNSSAATGNANGVTAKSYIDFGKDLSKNGLGANDFTMAFWYKPDPALNSWGALLGNKNYDSGGNKGLALGYYGADSKMNFVPASGTKAELGGIDLTQAGWHHFAVTVKSGSSMSVYLDGESVGSKALTAGTVDVDLPLIIGADGNKKWPITNLVMDDLRIYSAALSADHVREVYDLYSGAVKAANSTLELDKMLAALSAMEESVLFPQSAIDAMKEKLLQAKQDMAGKTPGEIAALLEAVNAEYQTFLNGATPLASFHLISDVHITSVGDEAYRNYVAALKDMKTLNPDTTIAFVNGGDFTNNSGAGEYSAFYSATADNNPATDEQTLILLGNHDVRGVAGANQVNWNRDPSQPEKCVYWETAKSLYKTNNAPYMPASAQDTLYHSKVLGGYTFIMLNTELGLKDAMYMSPAQLEWFEQTMKTAYEADPEKPIFIVSHQALNDTHWMSNVLDGFDGVKADGTGQSYQTGADAKVKEIMARYPTGILMSGHIHNNFGMAEVVMREYGILVDMPSMNQPGIGLSDKGTGYEVMIYDGAVAFRARNFATGTWLPEYDVIVTTGENSAPAAAKKARELLDQELWYSEEDAQTIHAAADPLLELLNKTYDQSALSWNNTAPPAKYLYHGDTHTAIGEAIPPVLELGPFQKLDKPRVSPFETLRLRWREYLLGKDLDLTDSAVKTYVQNLNDEANGYWNSMLKSNVTRTNLLFPDLNMTQDGTNTRSGNIGTTLNRLRTLAIAWATPGCDLYQNDYVRDEIISATDLVVERHFQYGKYVNRGAPGNWYHWEITSPTALGNITMVMYDALGAERVERYARTIQYYAPYCDKGGPNSAGPAMTAGNLLLKANGVAQAGILLEDASMLENVRQGVKSAIVYNDPDNLFSTGNPGDGFYADGSFIQHQALPYIAGYGADLYNNFGIFSLLFKGTDWEIVYTDGEEPVVYDFVFSGIEPFIYETRTMDIVAGRAITRNGSSDVGRTAGILSGLIALRGSFPTEEQNRRFDSMMKFFIGRDAEGYYSRMGNITSLQMAKALMEDESVQPRSNYLFTKTFAMDRTVHITPTFGFALAMQSTRTFAHEIINNEGKRTWNIANGMFFLYDADEGQYNGGYWATVDPTRLPGITAEHVVLANGRGSLNTNIYDWTGGASLEGSGVAGMHMKALSRNDAPASYSTGPRTGADMKKSWFLFGDRILMLGSGITSTTGDSVETTVDNRKLRPDGANTVTVDGAVAQLSTDPNAPSTLANPTWIHLEGNVDGADVGYYFPEDITLQAIRDTRTGNWADQGTTSGTATDTYATFYVDHGVKPTGAGYAYLLLPGRSADETAAYAAAPDVVILQNDEAIQAAQDKRQGITAANFWTAGSVGGIIAGKPCAVILERKGDTVTIGVSDPTQRDVAIPVTLALCGDVVAADEGITVTRTEPYVEFTVDTTEGLGGTYTLTLKVKETQELELLRTLTATKTVEVPAHTLFNDLPLPQEGIFLASDGTERTLPLSWSRGSYESGMPGTYTLAGAPVLPENITNPQALAVTVTVVLGKNYQLALGDTYVNDGSQSGTNFGTSANLVVKSDTNAGYNRQALFQFDLTGLPTDYEKMEFVFQGSYDTSSSTSWGGGAVYRVEDDWSADTVTWDTKPATVGAAPIATFGKSDFSAGVVRVDLTGTVRAAQAAGEKVLSIMVACAGTPGQKNQMNISSLESDAAQKPALVWPQSQGVPAEADKENLRFLVKIARELDAALFQPFSQEELTAALAAAQAVLDDGNATMPQINDAEDAIMRVLLALRYRPKAE